MRVGDVPLLARVMRHLNREPEGVLALRNLISAFVLFTCHLLFLPDARQSNPSTSRLITNSSTPCYSSYREIRMVIGCSLHPREAALPSEVAHH
jgi:hypothetical protein